MNELIKITNLSKSFGQIKAVDNVSFEVGNGEFLVIQGRSGSGKTTLLGLIAGLDGADRGEIKVDGRDITKMSEDELALYRRKNIGIVFQFFNLIPTLNVVENIALPLFPEKINPKEMFEKARAAASEVGMGHRLNHYPSELSGGEQQRTAIARALINKPKVILADEPTGNLDSKTGEEIIGFLKDLNKTQKLTIVMISHDERIAKEADRVIKIKDGAIQNE